MFEICARFYSFTNDFIFKWFYFILFKEIKGVFFLKYRAIYIEKQKNNSEADSILEMLKSQPLSKCQYIIVYENVI